VIGTCGTSYGREIPVAPKPCAASSAKKHNRILEVLTGLWSRRSKAAIPFPVFSPAPCINFHRNGQIPRRNSVGFEERHFGIAGPAAGFPGDYIGKLFDARPANLVAVNAIMRSPASWRDCSTESTTMTFCAGHGFVIEFALMRMVGANRVDVDTRRQIPSVRTGCEAVVAVDTISAPRAASPAEVAGLTGIPSRSDISLQNFSRLAASRP